MPTILIVEDEAKMRRLLELNLGEDGFTTLSAGDAEAGLKLLRENSVDLVVTDLKLPGMNGLEFLQAIKRQNAALPVVVMTAFGTVETAVEAMKAGASGFLLKDATREQLTGAIRAVCAGETLLAPAITRRLIEDFCRGPLPGTAAGGTAGGLSERELEVVRLVAQGLSNAEVAARLYLSEATVKSHVARVLAKLGLRDRVQVVVYAYEHGIVRPGGRP